MTIKDFSYYIIHDLSCNEATNSKIAETGTRGEKMTVKLKPDNHAIQTNQQLRKFRSLFRGRLT